MSEPIDTEKMVAHYRERVIQVGGRSVLLANIGDSTQKQDLKLPPNCNGLGRIHHFSRRIDPDWPLNPIPIEPASKALGIIAEDMLKAQVFQIAGCPWRCWYCFVPERLLSANSAHAVWVTPNQLIDMYFASEGLPRVIDLSGGAPDLAPEWVVWIMEELIHRGRQDDVYLWSDDSLSTDYLWTSLNDHQRDTLSRFKNYGHVACFKGFDERSFEFNTRASPEGFERQLARFGRLLTLGVDLYGYVTLTASPDSDVDSGVPRFLDRLQSLHPNLPLRTVPLFVMKFSPTGQRMTADREESLTIQRRAINVWLREIEVRFAPKIREAKITDVPLRG